MDRARRGRLYGLTILLPEEVEQRLRNWVAHTPGATWPEWRGHITVVPAFVALDSPDAIEAAVARVCQAYAPFRLTLNRIRRTQHLIRPHLQTVLLVEPARTAPGPLHRLRADLAAILAPVKEDVHPVYSNHPFLPHVSLTWGLPELEASRLARAARAARLEVSLTVDQLWLVALSPTGTDALQVDDTRTKLFRLGAAPPLARRAGAAGGHRQATPPPPAARRGIRAPQAAREGDASLRSA